MSFRGRLFIFFTIIVIVPMAAVAVVLFKITSDSETGKSDSRIAQGLTTALAVYQADADRAQTALTQVARDPQQPSPRVEDLFAVLPLFPQAQKRLLRDVERHIGVEPASIDQRPDFPAMTLVQSLEVSPSQS